MNQTILKYFIPAVLFLFQNTISAQDKPKDSLRLSMPASDCIRLMAHYRYSWIADSQATSGFRELMASEILINCKGWKGTDWNDVCWYLGNPHYTIVNGEAKQKNEIWYRYVLLCYIGYKHYLEEVDSKYLDFCVRDGKIIRVSLNETGGDYAFAGLVNQQVATLPLH